MPTTWLCKKCQTLNRQTDTSCDECFTDRDSGKDELGEEERIVDLSKIPKHKMFYFLVSQHTNRIFLHDKVNICLNIEKIKQNCVFSSMKWTIYLVIDPTIVLLLRIWLRISLVPSYKVTCHISTHGLPYCSLFWGFTILLVILSMN